MSDEDFYSDIRAYSAVADAVGCQASEVGRAFSEFVAPEMLTAPRLDEFKASADAIEEAQRRVLAALKALDKLPDIQRVIVEHNGKPTVHLRAAFLHLNAHRRELRYWLRRAPRPGGKVPAADAVLSGLSRLFANLGLDKTWGHASGQPNTLWGRAVKTAFDAFEVGIDWREPARKARTASKTRSRK